ncbi:tetratricopeptide repeat protein [Jannaschia ovalis]|uniref:Tetratricopeptide repeat protein n=1 Tax=Jannaschia ovalis TaxID=3038773 RepID=A0ABY8LE25_9RHOB|nr:tetratricopeptide repeat protein [Jannaschia sp. GRR-S6-38]WGH79568.1 tetratricopeptide repeat protein [Jannaschia sp. GRR-S6-38]
MIRPLLLAATLLAAPMAQAQGTAGPYLAARIAGFSNDYAAAGRYYDRLIRAEAAGPQVLENAIVINSVLGRFDRAAEAAQMLEEAGGSSQFGDNARLVVALQEGDFARASELMTDATIGGTLLDGLLRGWIAAAGGETARALEAFDAVAETQSFAAIAHLHKAFVLSMAGDFESAEEIYSGEKHGPMNLTARGVEAHAQALVQLDRRDDALELLEAALGLTNSPVLEDLQARIAAGETVLWDVIRDPKDGMAEAYFTLAAILAGETSATYALLNARAATVLRPDHVDGAVLVGELMEEQGQYALADEALTAVPRDHPSYFAAEITRAEILLAAEREEAALEVLSALTRSNPDRRLVWTAYADALRRLERFERAADAYDRALALVDEVTARDWFLFYARGIAREREDRWEEAEGDFRRALELNPDQPQVLNYLGYGLVEKRVKLDEALDMIERAVAARPDDGYITDSLGWVLYRLGRYDEAVEPMERAVQLRPMDPIINDHLGDVLWMVDRKREARFQWRRALSLDPEEAEAERIRRKLEVGLEIVLEEEEAAAPIAAAQE